MGNFRGNAGEYGGEKEALKWENLGQHITLKP